MEYSRCWQRSQRLREVDGGHAMGQRHEFAHHPSATSMLLGKLRFHCVIGDMSSWESYVLLPLPLPPFQGKWGVTPPHQESGAGVREPPRELGKCLLGSGGPRDYPSPTPEKL